MTLKWTNSTLISVLEIVNSFPEEWTTTIHTYACTWECGANQLCAYIVYTIHGVLDIISKEHVLYLWLDIFKDHVSVYTVILSEHTSSFCTDIPRKYS